ncbi:hypothetical protein LX81_02623 [Palleronia aestuarii]|uniref:Uncharacterized protein n=1 Tax=Palleronia aestuarii TaxID=568105 RepID=A0A2W7N3T3_9RHOB|nr:hypothetical protein [Palleronia aestuarii]PZX15035.1 hypothetical protein LX81_02623 [Palleronia aestuarii]
MMGLKEIAKLVVASVAPKPAPAAPRGREKRVSRVDIKALLDRELGSLPPLAE